MFNGIKNILNGVKIYYKLMKLKNKNSSKSNSLITSVWVSLFHHTNVIIKINYLLYHTQC